MQHAYQKEPAVIFDAIARLRFPNYKITGSGPLALILECSQKVILCAIPLEAEARLADSCGALCNHPDHFHAWHRIEELNVPPKPQPRRVDWLRD